MSCPVLPQPSSPQNHLKSALHTRPLYSARVFVPRACAFLHPTLPSAASPTVHVSTGNRILVG